MERELGLKLTAHRENIQWQSKRKQFRLTFYVRSGVDLETVRLRAEMIHSAHRVDARDQLGPRTPHGTWAIVPLYNIVYFIGDISETDLYNARFGQEDDKAVNALEEVARIVGAAIWHHLQPHGRDITQVDLGYEGGQYVFHLTPEQVWRKRSA